MTSNLEHITDCFCPVCLLIRGMVDSNAQMGEYDDQPFCEVDMDIGGGKTLLLMVSDTSLASTVRRLLGKIVPAVAV